MPPSAITGTSAARAASAASRMAVSCGTPTPATIRVVQIEPGPMPTLIASAPASISACAPSRVATLPAMTATLLVARWMRRTWLQHLLGMAVRGVDDEAVDAGRHQELGALESLVADRGRGGDAQAPVPVLGGVGMGGRLLDVLDGDEADAARRLVDDDKLLDPMLMQEPARLVAADPLPDRHHLAGHQFGDRLARIVGEAHVAIGEDADELRRLAVRAALDHRNSRDRGAPHDGERVGQRRVGKDGDRIDHHAALEALDLAHFLGLVGGLEIAVDDPDAARLRHGDGEPRLGDGVHRRGDDRQVEPDRAGEPRPDIGGARHDRAMAGAQQHVVEREPLGKAGLNVRHSRHPSSDPAGGIAPSSAAWRGCLTWPARSS